MQGRLKNSEDKVDLQTREQIMLKKTIDTKQENKTCIMKDGKVRINIEK